MQATLRSCGDAFIPCCSEIISHVRPTAATSVTAEKLFTFFEDKVQAVRDSTADAAEPVIRHITNKSFSSFEMCSMEDVRRVLLESPAKSCSLDPLPTFLLREFVDDLLPSSQTY